MSENQCIQCQIVIPPTRRPGRPSSFCGDDCRRDRGRELRPNGKQRGARVYIPCSGCQKPMQLTWSSAGVMTCNPCRRSASQAKKIEAAKGPWTKSCAAAGCDSQFVAKQPTRRYCSQDCLLTSHRAMERIRDAERRRKRREERPVEALAWNGDVEANALIFGPPQHATTVKLVIEEWGDYRIRCAECDWLALFVAPEAWACSGCYIKYVLIHEPEGVRPMADWAWVHAA